MIYYLPVRSLAEKQFTNVLLSSDKHKLEAYTTIETRKNGANRANAYCFPNATASHESTAWVWLNVIAICEYFLSSRRMFQFCVCVCDEHQTLLTQRQWTHKNTGSMPRIYDRLTAISWFFRFRVDLAVLAHTSARLAECGMAWNECVCFRNSFIGRDPEIHSRCITSEGISW